MLQDVIVYDSEMPTHLIENVPIARLRAARLCTGDGTNPKIYGVSVFDDATVASSNSFVALTATRRTIFDMLEAMKAEYEFIDVPTLDRILRAFEFSSVVDLDFDQRFTKLTVTAGSSSLTLPWRPSPAADLSLYFSDLNKVDTPFTLNVEILSMVLEAGKILAEGSHLKLVRFMSMSSPHHPLTFSLHDSDHAVVGYVVQMPVRMGL